MSTDYLSNTRAGSLTDNSNVSEAELHATHENIKEMWLDLQKLKRDIIQEKIEASKAIDLKYAERLATLTGDYALMIKMTR